MYKDEDVTLNNGVKMPKLMFGTWRMWVRNDMGYNPTMWALQSGCRCIDTAQAYNTEYGVGKAIKECGIARNKLFVSTKLDPDYVCDAKTAKEAFDKSLKNLGIEYIDIMYIHAPSSWDRCSEHDNVGIYKFLETMVKEGKLRCIGISNFTVEELKDLLSKVDIVPQAMQIQLSVGCENKELVEFCKENNITIVPYSPLASGYLLRNQEFKEIASSINNNPSKVTNADIALDYVTQKYGTCLFGSENEAHVKKTMQLDKILSDNDIKVLDKLSKEIGDQNMWSYEGNWVKDPINP